MTRILALSLSASLLWCRSGNAQAITPVRIGARISVSVPDSTCGRPWRRCASGAGLGGTLVRMTPDTLIVQFGPLLTLPIPRTPDQHVFVSTGVSRLRSALRSAVMAGLATGVIVSQTNASRRSMVQTTAGIMLGGLALGALLPTERWQRVEK